MPHDFANLVRPARTTPFLRTAALVAALALAGGVWRLLVPPTWIVKRLDSPDGRRSALLTRRQYLRQNFVVLVKDGGLWHTAYYSPPLTNDFRVDLEERLVWSEDSRRLCLFLRNRAVWGLDFVERRKLSPEELAAAEQEDARRRSAAPAP